MRNDNKKTTKIIVSLAITLIFLILHQRSPTGFLSSHLGTSLLGHLTDFKTNNDTSETVSSHKPLKRKSKIVRTFNNDASLSPPYLDKINNNWFVGGETEIKNYEYVRLTNAGAKNQHGVLLSNGVGDNTINDFETIFTFRIKQCGGDGMTFLISSENGFLYKDLRGSFALRQYVLNSGGVMAGDYSMMGFPRNLPGLAVVLDTYGNKNNANRDRVPFIDLFVNTIPQEHLYDLDSDGEESSSHRLNSDHIPLRKNVISGDLLKLRIIYMESISFLKIDIQYENEGDYWIELFQTNENLMLPKNKNTGQRYVGIGGLTGDMTQTVELYDIETNEFHWENGDESLEDTFDYAKEAQLFLEQEFQEKIEIERDRFTKWKMMKSQPNYHLYTDENTKQDATLNGSNDHGALSKLLSILWNFLFGMFVLIVVYLISVYIRVARRHFQRMKKRHGGKRRSWSNTSGISSGFSSGCSSASSSPLLPI